MTSPATPTPSQPGYAGDVSPAEAWRRAQAGEAVIIDVRTPDELHWVGRIPGVTNVPWVLDRTQARNPQFLEQLAAQIARDRPALFLCRSGVRSIAAAKAATEAGFASAWNIVGGFEGAIDEHRQRGKLGGWRAAGLPWEQS